MNVERRIRPWNVKPHSGYNDNRKFYNSSQWKRTRKAFLLQNPICIRCEEEGIATPAQVVDHIIPIQKEGHKIDFSNLQSLCYRHHAIKSAKDK